MGIVDLLFPKRCVGCKAIGSFVCANCFAHISFVDHDICLACNRPTLNGLTHPMCQTTYVIDGAFASIVYKGVVRRMIQQYKYQPYLSSLAAQLGELFFEGLIQKERLSQILLTKPVLMPIPLHKTKLRKRGYNQAALLTKQLADKLELEVHDGLERVKTTSTQTTLTRFERRQNIAGAFAVMPVANEPLEGATVCLVDDVLTSGATFLEAAKVLKKAGVKCVYGLALAHE